MRDDVAHDATASDRDAGGLVRHLLSQRFKELAARHEVSPVLTPEVLSDFFLSNCFVALMSWANAPHTSLEATLKSTMQLFLLGAKPTPKK